VLRYTRKMDALAESLDSRALSASGWEARLAFSFAHNVSRTVLAARRYLGPLRVQKALYPEGPEICQAIIVHPPSGIVGGDRLAIAIDVGARAHAQITTPGAAKWYRSAGVDAVASTKLAVGSGSVLEWLPQESLLFDGARATITLRIDLAADARFVGWDIVGLGRIASGERFASGRFHQTVELCHAGAPVWCERTVLEGESAALQSGAVLAGAPVFGTMIVAGAVVDDALLATCRAIARTCDGASVTRLPHVLVARYRGDSAPAARAYFALQWNALRPTLVGRAAVPPRIWNT
jgi:urease accessory protein